MRKLALLAAAAAALACGACCSIETQGLENLGKPQAIINAELLRYVEADAKLDAKRKTDWKDLVRSENDLRAALLKRK